MRRYCASHRVQLLRRFAVTVIAHPLDWRESGGSPPEVHAE